MSASGELMAGALHNLGVHFVLGGQGKPTELSPASFILALAQSTEARLRLALIPLFLKRPDFAAYGGGSTSRICGCHLVMLFYNNHAPSKTTQQ